MSLRLDAVPCCCTALASTIWKSSVGRPRACNSTAFSVMADPAVSSNPRTTSEGRMSKSYLIIVWRAHFTQQIKEAHWLRQHTLV